MKKIPLILLLLSFAAFGRSTRVMTYNVHNGWGLDNITDYARIGRLIATLEPEVVAIQEVDSVTGRSRGCMVLDSIAAAAGMVPTFASAIDFDGGRYGIGILSKTKPLVSYQIALPGREEERTMLVCEFPDYVFACVHLSLTEADRIASVPLITAEMQKTTKPFILAGDWNSSPESGVLDALSDYLVVLTDITEPTFPADKPFDTIDYIAISRNTEASATPVVHQGHLESDHLPVTADIEW